MARTVTTTSKTARTRTGIGKSKVIRRSSGGGGSSAPAKKKAVSTTVKRLPDGSRVIVTKDFSSGKVISTTYKDAQGRTTTQAPAGESVSSTGERPTTKPIPEAHSGERFETTEPGRTGFAGGRVSAIYEGKKSEGARQVFTPSRSEIKRPGREPSFASVRAEIDKGKPLPERRTETRRIEMPPGEAERYQAFFSRYGLTKAEDIFAGVKARTLEVKKRGQELILMKKETRKETVETIDTEAPPTIPVKKAGEETINTDQMLTLPHELMSDLYHSELKGDPNKLIQPLPPSNIEKVETWLQEKYNLNVEKKISRNFFQDLKHNPLLISAQLFKGAIVNPAVSFMKFGSGIMKGKIEGFPKETYHTFKFAVTNPPQFIETMFTEFTRRPAEFTGEVITYSQVFKVSGKLIKKSPVKIEYAKFEYPLKTGEVTSYRGLGIKTKTKSVSPIGVKDGKITLGKPYFEVYDLNLKSGIKPGTTTETNILLKSARDVLPEAEMTKIKIGREIFSKTDTTTSKFVSELPPKTQTLSFEGVEISYKFIAERKPTSTLYGSSPTQAQVIKGSLEKARGSKPGEVIIGDLDIQTTLSIKQTEVYTGELLRKLKEGGEKVKISKDRPTLIEETKTGRHALDIHSFEEPYADILQPSKSTTQAFGLSINQPPVFLKTESGLVVKSMALSEQGVRKGASMFTLREVSSPTQKNIPRKVGSSEPRPTLKFYPEAHRVKDIQDFFAIQESLIKSKPLRKQKKLLDKLEELKKFYPEELKGKEITETLTTPVKKVDVVSSGIALGTRAKPSISSRTSKKKSSFSPGSAQFSPRSPSSRSGSISKRSGSIISPSLSIASVSITSPSSSIMKSLSASSSSSSGSSSGSSSSRSSSSRSSSSGSSSSRSSSSRSSSSETPSSKIPPSQKLMREEQGKKTRQGFNVFVRESKPKGKGGKRFFRVNASTLPRNKALNRGADIVDNSSARTFKIIEASRTRTQDDSSFRRSDKFRSPTGRTKLPKNSFVEKTRYAIDSMGELRGITAKGLIAKRRKAKKTPSKNKRLFSRR